MRGGGVDEKGWGREEGGRRVDKRGGVRQLILILIAYYHYDIILMIFRN